MLVALVRLNGGSSLEKGGIPAEPYQAFASVFVPRILEAVRLFLREGGLPDDWTMALLKCLPKCPERRKRKTARWHCRMLV